MRRMAISVLRGLFGVFATFGMAVFVFFAVAWMLGRCESSPWFDGSDVMACSLPRLAVMVFF